RVRTRIALWSWRHVRRAGLGLFASNAGAAMVQGDDRADAPSALDTGLRSVSLARFRRLGAAMADGGTPVRCRAETRIRCRRGIRPRLSGCASQRLARHVGQRDGRTIEQLAQFLRRPSAAPVREPGDAQLRRFRSKIGLADMETMAATDGDG